MPKTNFVSIVLMSSALALPVGAAWAEGASDANTGSGMMMDRDRHMQGNMEGHMQEHMQGMSEHMKGKDQTSSLWQSAKQAFEEGVIKGRVETALLVNEHLDAFAIDVEVKDGVVHLNGSVPGMVEKELAEEIAAGAQDKFKVENGIKIDKKLARSNKEKNPSASAGRRSLGQVLKDATLTAEIKADLLASDSIRGFGVNVDTNTNRVTLSGTVGSEAEKALAEKLVEKHKNVTEITNNLKIKKS